MEALLCLLAQSYFSQPQNAEGLDRLMSYTSALQRCTAYIDAHFKEPLSLSELSKRFGMSRSSFCTVFPRYAGMPLRQYIAKRRIEEAQMLIRSDPALPLAAVAAEVGYADPTTFYRNFLRITGISPAAYRTLGRVEEGK